MKQDNGFFINLCPYVKILIRQFWHKCKIIIPIFYKQTLNESIAKYSSEYINNYVNTKLSIEIIAINETRLLSSKL